MRLSRVLPVALLVAVAAAMMAVPASAYQRYRYPLKGPHNYGNLDVTGFGVKRADGSVHTGQDIIANCGTPIVAAHSGVIKSAGYSTGYGNYVVVAGQGTRFDFVYGHMKGRARVGTDVGSVRAEPRLRRQDGDGQRRLPPALRALEGPLVRPRQPHPPLPHLRAWDKFSGGQLQTEPPPPQGQYSASKRLSTTRRSSRVQTAP